MKARRLRILASVLLLGLGALPATAMERDFFHGEAISDYQRYRAYPHIDRGMREYATKNYLAAVKAFKRAQEAAPASARIRIALARAYAGEGLLEQAESELQALAPQHPEAVAALFDLRTVRLGGQTPVAPKILRSWLDDCTPAWCGPYAAMAVSYLVDRRQPAAAREILSAYRKLGQDSDPRRTLLLESAVAEGLGDWSGAVKALRAAAIIRPLGLAESYRYGLALLGIGDFDGVHGLLAERLANTAEGQQLAGELVQRAIGAGRAATALEQLDRLEAQGALARQDQVQRLRLLISAGRRSEAEGVFTALERSGCALSHTPGKCLQVAPAGMSEVEWLEVAGQLGRTDILTKSYPRSSAGRLRRLQLLAEHFQKGGDDARLIKLLQRAPADRQLSATLALAYERTGERLAAAEQLERAFKRWRQWTDLEQASYLYVAVGAQERAQRLLESAQPFPRDGQGERLLQRLLDIYQESPQTVDAQRLEALENQVRSVGQIETLAELWRRQGRCDNSIDLLEGRHPGGPGLLVLAECYRRVKPAIAVGYYEQALSYAPELATRSLAYLQAEMGNHRAALARWQSLPPSALSRSDRMAAASAAMEAGVLAEARRWWRESESRDDAEWQRLGGRLEEKAGRLPPALEYWREAHRLAPNVESAYAMGRLSAALGRPDEAVSSYREALRLQPQEDEVRLSLAYALISTEPAEAAKLLEGSSRQGAARFPIEEQLGYLNIRLGDNEAARRHLTAAVDLSGEFLAALGADEAADRSFALRRSRESLDRRWSLAFSTWLASGGVPGELILGRPTTDRSPRHYAEVGAEWRLGQEPMDKFRFLALTARAGVQGNSRDDYLQGQGMFGLGLRWKPLSEWNLYLAAEQQFPLDGGGKSDFMIRATASLLDQGIYRGDWHASGRSWPQQELYLDAAKWLDSGRYSVLARYTYGRNYKLKESASAIGPYAFLQGEKRSDGSDSRWGVGIAFRFWRDEDRYTAYRQNLIAKVERQQVIDSDLADDDGWFLKLEGSW